MREKTMTLQALADWLDPFDPTQANVSDTSPQSYADRVESHACERQR